MKKILYFFIIFFFSLKNYAQQVPLYDKSGIASAHIDYDEAATIFLWDGTPLAFIEKGNEDSFYIYGFNKLFLGFYKNGKIVDQQGMIVGAVIGIIDDVEYKQNHKIKGIQRIIPIKPILPFKTYKTPKCENKWSSTSLSDFLYLGKK